MKTFSLKEAVEQIGEDATYRAVRYYKDKEGFKEEVFKEGGVYYVTEKFIEKVKKVRFLNKQTIKDNDATKTELLKEIESLKGYLKQIEALKKELSEAKEIIKDYEDSLVFEKAEEGQKVEVFTLEEYAIFSERLNEWKNQRKEIELRIEINAELKEDKNYLKARNEYLELSNNKILEQHEKLIEAIQQRNRIEAVEKGVIPKEPKEI